MYRPDTVAVRAASSFALAASLALPAAAWAQADPARDFPQRPLRIMACVFYADLQ